MKWIGIALRSAEQIEGFVGGGAFGVAQSPVLKLFVKNSYDGTTLDAIAQAAGISRRTFFYYFKSKEDVLLAAHDSGFRER